MTFTIKRAHAIVLAVLAIFGVSLVTGSVAYATGIANTRAFTSTQAVPVDLHPGGGDPAKYQNITGAWVSEILVNGRKCVVIQRNGWNGDSSLTNTIGISCNWK